MQFMLLPSSPLMCQVSPSFLQHLTSQESSFVAARSVPSRISKHAPVSEDYRNELSGVSVSGSVSDAAGHSTMGVLHFGTQSGDKPHPQSSIHEVPVGDRNRMGYFHLLPERLASYFGLHVPLDEDSPPASPSSSVIPSDDGTGPASQVDSITRAPKSNPGREHDIMTLQDVRDLLAEFGDYAWTMSQGAALCTITASAEFVHHVTKGISHDEVMRLGLRALYPGGNISALDTRFGACKAFLHYADHHSRLGEVTLVYILICLSIYLVCATAFSTSLKEDSKDDSQELTTNQPIMGTGGDDTTLVGCPQDDSQAPSPSASDVSQAQVTDDSASLTSSHPANAEVETRSLIEEEVVLAERRAALRRSVPFRSPTKTPSKTPRFRRRHHRAGHRQLLAAVAELLAQRKHRSGQFDYTGISEVVDRGVLPESFVAKVSALATPARERLEARLETAAYLQTPGEAAEEDEEQDLDPAVEAQYFSELLKGIDVDDEPPIGLIDAIEPHAVAEESTIEEETGALTEDLKASSTAAMRLSTSADVVEEEEKEVVAVPRSAPSNQELMELAPTQMELTVDEVKAESKAEAQSSLDSACTSQLHAASARDAPSVATSPDQQQQVRKAQSETQRLRAQFESFDLAQASDGVRLLELLPRFSPSAVVAREATHEDIDASSTILWMCARACYVSVQELQQITNLAKEGNTDEPDPHRYRDRLAAARHELTRAYQSLINFDIEVADELFWSRLGLRFAYLSLEIKPSSSAHKWVAIMADKVGQVTDRKTRIENSKIFLEHTKAAIALNSEDPTLHHMLGRFQFEIASLSWWQRTAAAAIYGALPECTMAEAQQSLEKAQQLRPQWPLNLLYLGRAMINNGQQDEGNRWLSHLANLTDASQVTTEDRMAVAEAKKLLGL